MLDDAIRKVSSVEPPWDDLRDRRVLAAILAPQRPSKAPLLLAVSATLCAVGIAAVLRATPTTGVASRATPAPQPLALVESRLALADGSVAVVAPGADVRIAEESATAVRVVQRAGSVRYDVRPAADRRFVVEAGGVRVEVVGTAFTIAVEAEGARVRVDRGQVRVDDGARRIDLRAGEELLVTPVLPTAPATPVPAEPAPRPTQTTSTPAPPPFADLIERADDARAEGRLADAADLLRAAAAAHPADPGLPTAYFTLGRIERTLGRPTQAADAYRRCRASAAGSLAEDALVEEAEALADAEHFDESREAARLYLDRYPRGTHRWRVAPLAE